MNSQEKKRPGRCRQKILKALESRRIIEPKSRDHSDYSPDYLVEDWGKSTMAN
jgi:hypothetical protein